VIGGGQKKGGWNTGAKKNCSKTSASVFGGRKKKNSATGKAAIERIEGSWPRVQKQKWNRHGGVCKKKRKKKIGDTGWTHRGGGVVLDDISQLPHDHTGRHQGMAIREKKK